MLPLTWLDDPVKTGKASGDITIHPSTFDGLFQFSFVALGGRTSKSMRAMIPTRVGRAWVSSSGFGLDFDDDQDVHISTSLLSQRLAQSNVIAFSGCSHGPRIIVQELELTAISGLQARQDSHAKKKYLGYHMDWKVDLDLAESNFIFDLCEQARKSVHNPVEWFTDIETLALSYGAQALQELKEQSRSPPENLTQYVAWLQDQLERDDSSTPPEQREQRRRTLFDKEQLGQLSEKMKRSNNRGELYTKVGEHLKEILSGELDPLEFLFSEDDLVAQFYAEMNTDSTAFEAVRAYLEVLTHKTPDLNFLEIGAGTGATTIILMSAIERPNGVTHYGAYAFTDISPRFFEKAKELFPSRPRMQYLPLNIEQDPASQGFECGAYDLIIASLVLHATQDLSVTLKNARKLLKTGGKLIFMEMTVPNMARTGFAFGFASRLVAKYGTL